MPSDLNGIYSLPINYLAVVGEIIVPAQHNGPLEDIGAGLTARLMRSGAGGMNGPLKGADGSAGAPSFTFGTAATTGVYKTADGVGVSVMGSQVAEFTSGGLTKGARYIGELIPYVGSVAPAKTVFPVGQTLSRTTYADLWAFAQTEIAAGSTFFNNGNGTTTFGIGDLRGRVLAGKDDMGGSSAGVLTSSFFASPNTVGAVGGAQSRTLATANLPPYTPAGTITNGAITMSPASVSSPGSTFFSGGGAGAVNGGSANTATQAASTFTGTAQGGTSNAFGIIQPTMICNWLLYAGA